MVLDTYPDTIWEAVVESLSPATGAEFAILPPQGGAALAIQQKHQRRFRFYVHLRVVPCRFQFLVAFDQLFMQSLILPDRFLQ